mmetsp:Transcript_10543/g.21050  ORF Transcript_10543/g.21050 Transcript_10543/m.21050 type:complete len:212 (+) Transcript_10543:254-889(+)
MRASFSARTATLGGGDEGNGAGKTFTAGPPARAGSEFFNVRAAAAATVVAAFAVAAAAAAAASKSRVLSRRALVSLERPAAVFAYCTSLASKRPSSRPIFALDSPDRLLSSFSSFMSSFMKRISSLIRLFSVKIEADSASLSLASRDRISSCSASILSSASSLVFCLSTMNLRSRSASSLRWRASCASTASSSLEIRASVSSLAARKSSSF